MEIVIERKRYSYTFITIAPLVDIVFLLLLFFLLTSSIRTETEMRVKLPESETATAAENSVINLYIMESGEIYLMNRQVDLGRLRDEIAKTAQTRKSDSVRIKADKKSDVGVLVTVIDEVRLAGIKNYGVITEKK